MSDALIFAVIFLLIFSGWVIGAVLAAEPRSKSGLRNPKTIHIWFAGNLAADRAGLPRRLRSALKRELAVLPRRLPIRTGLLRRRFPADREAWTRLLANAPETIANILPADRPGVLIWAECVKGAVTARLHFLASPKLAAHSDPGTIGLRTLDDVPLELRPGLAPIFAALALAHLAPVLREAGFRRASFLAIPAKKLALHIDEIRDQCAGPLGAAASYLYAWLRFRLALDAGQKSDPDALYRELNTEITNWPEDRPARERAQIWNSLAKLCLDWGLRWRAPDTFERSFLAADKAIAILSEENSSLDMAAARHVKGRALLALGQIRRDPGSLEKALKVLRSAAQFYRTEGHSARWALSRHDMGEVHAAYARIRGGTKDLERAITAFEDAFSNARGKPGVARARSRQALGVARLELGRRDGKRHHFEKAAREFEEAFGALSAVGQFEGANAAQTAAAMARMYLGRQTGDPRPLRRAAEDLRLAPRPTDYGSGDQCDWRLLPGRVHRLLGAAEGSPNPLRKSVQEFGALSLANGTAGQAELRAMANFERGLALAELGRAMESAEEYGQAADAFRGALLGFDRRTSPRRWALAQLQLGRVLLEMADSGGGRENGAAGEAAGAYREALSVFDRTEMPHIWTAIQDELGTALKLSGAKQGGTPALEGAVKAWRKALNGHKPAAAPARERTMMLNDLGNALCDLAYAENDAGRLREARSAYLEAFDLAMADSEESFAEIARANLDLVEQAISAPIRRF